MLIQKKLEILAAAPDLLIELLEQIPKELLKVRRKPGKWSIHENAVHLEEAEKMIFQRFKRFKSERNPVFTPYLPGNTVSDDYLIDLNLEESLLNFRKDRSTLVNFLSTFTKEDWENQGKHPEYSQFNSQIWLRHVMMHDHFHMYRIEELWLTTDDYL